MHIVNSIIAILLGGMLIVGCSGDTNGRIQSSGTIEGTDINVGSEVAGRVKEVRVEEGARVNKGDTLVVIDDADYQIQLRQAVANEEAAQAQYAIAIEGSRKEDIIQAEAAFKNAEKDYHRMQDLLTSQSVTQKQFDDAEARYIAAKQTYDKLFQGLRKNEIAGVRARRDQAVAQADQIRKKVKDCCVVSQANGTVTLRAIQPGELVGMGTTLLRLTYLDQVKLTIYVSEKQISLVQLGQKATVTIDAGDSFEGKVIYKSPVAEFTPKNVQTKEERTKLVFGVKIQVDNPQGKLSPGIPADATIP